MIQLLAAAVADTGGHLRFAELGLDPNVFSIGFFTLRWYSLAYIAGILIGWWYLLKLLAQPGAPMAKRHADDLVFYATLGIILGGRLGYVVFYAPEMLLEPWRVLRLWDGGMSFHGGVIGTSLGLILFARANKLDWLRIHDYVACAVPFGLAEPARHPSQLYEAGLEGIALFALLWLMFWRTNARYQPGKLVGTFLVGYGLARFTAEFFREPDSQLRGFAEATGLHMGQWLCVPMIAGGAYLIATANGRRTRVEPIAGAHSVA